MSHTNCAELLVRNDRGELRIATWDEVIGAAREMMSAKVRHRKSMASPQLVKEFLSIRLGRLEHEVFCLLLLDKRSRLIEYVELFRGTIDGASVHPREIVKLALAKNAAAVVLAHPHPSGIAEPSHADELITQRVKEALALVDIKVLDHLLGGNQCVTSDAEAMKFPRFSA